MARKIYNLPPEGIVPNKGVNELAQESNLDPAEWLEGLDVEPLPSGVRRRNGIVHASEVPGGPDIEQLLWSPSPPSIQPLQFTRTDSVPILANKWAQSFTAGSVFGMRAFDWKCNIIEGTSSWEAVELKMSLHEDSLGEPGAVRAGYEQDKFNVIAGSSVRRMGSGDDPSDFDDSNSPWLSFVNKETIPAALVVSNVYWCVVEATMSGNPSGLLNMSQAWIGNRNDPGPYGGGEALTFFGGSWISAVAMDAMFRMSLDSSARVITAIYDYQTADGINYHLLVYNNGAIYRQVAGVLSLLGSLDSAHGDDLLPSLATAQNVCFITNDESGDPSKKVYFDGAAIQVKNEGIAAPDGVADPDPVFLLEALGTLPPDDYYIDWYFWDSVNKVQSGTRWEGDIRNCPLFTVPASASTGSYKITGLPGLTRPNDSADKVRFNIFPKTTHIGKWVYSGVEQDVGYAPAFSISDPNLFSTEASFDHDLPPVHGVKAATSERQFIADIEDDPNAVRWSRVDGIDIDIESYPPANRREIGILEGGKVTALFLVPPNTLLVGKRNSVWAMNSERPHQTEEILIADGVGIAGHRAGLVAGRSLYFISAADKVKGPMVWDGASVRPLLNLDKTFKALNKSRLHLASCAHLAKDEARFQWWTLLARSGQTENDRIIVYDYNLDAWTVYRIKGSVINQVVESNEDEIFIGGYDSRERKADIGATDLGEAINGELALKAFSFGDIEAIKKLRGMRYVINQLVSGTIGLSIEVDYGESPAINRTLDLTGRLGGVLGTDVLGGQLFPLGGGGNQIKGEKFRSAGRIFKPKFKSTSEWELQRLSWLVQGVDRR